MSFKPLQYFLNMFSADPLYTSHYNTGLDITKVMLWSIFYLFGILQKNYRKIIPIVLLLNCP